MADTGLDLNHCQFREDDGDSISFSDWDDPITDLTKRKVVQYIDFVDDFDGEYPLYSTLLVGTMMRSDFAVILHSIIRLSCASAYRVRTLHYIPIFV